MTIEQQQAEFSERGWLTVDLPDRGAVLRVGERMLDHLRASALPRLASLEEYHSLVENDDRHIAFAHDLSTFFWREGFGTELIRSHLAFFRSFIGLDLHVQKYPYLRVVRPGRPGDAVPLHRDTYYGSSAYEISVFIPFTDVPEEAALRVVSGSHAEPDSAYPWVRGSGGDVTPGSPKHQLGYSYAPKLLDPSLAGRATPVPLRVGEALLFSLSLVHGSGTNDGCTTRFSTDIRVVNSLAPVEWSHSVHGDYYLPLCSSPVTAQARRYARANRAVSD